MAISDWHENDRPRGKLLKFGAEQLTDAELLAIFLRVGVKGKSAVDLAQDLLDQFGSLHALLAAEKTEFCQGKGLGEAKYVQLKAVLEMARRHFESGLKQGESFQNPESVVHYLHHSFPLDDARERFGMLLLNQKHQLIRFDILFEGTLNQASIYIREVVKHALMHHAAAVIIAHNHPSGDPSPSQADIELTKRLKSALALVEVTLLDHIILGNAGRWYALKQHHLI